MSALAPDPRHLNLAIMAMGGQGGGVLVDWLVALAEGQGWTVSATSVAGVAQRTGATIYYLEMVEPTPGREPVLALMAVPGQVDLVVAAELVEAGRAVDRGLVTPARTTLIASSHRTYSVNEKIVPGNGVADGSSVLQALQAAAHTLVLDDFQALAVRHGSVISASLLGAIAASEVLPFELAQFEAVIQAGGVGVAASLKAFHAGLQAGKSARQSGQTPAVVTAASMETPARSLPDANAVRDPAVRALVQRIRSEFAPPVWNWLGEGVARLVDWQDAAYAVDYLDEVAKLARHDDGSDGHALTVEAARWIAVAMSYDDVVRVADLKTRHERHQRVRGEVGAGAEDVVGTEEYFHPRIEEVLGLMPVVWANAIDARPALRAWLAQRLDRGRRIASNSVRGHLMLRWVAGLRTWRRRSRRHAEESAHWQQWLGAVLAQLPQRRALAVEMLRCRRLVKGYSDTHSRGLSRFDQLMRAAALLAADRADATQVLAQLRQAALRDASGQALLAACQAHGVPSS